MIRKLLAVLICSSMALTAPGMGELFAQGGRPVMTSSGKVVQILPAEREEALGNFGDLNVQDLQSTIGSMNASRQMKGRALDIVSRIEPYLKDGRMRPEDVKTVIETFAEKAKDVHANKEAALADLFDGLQAFAVRAEKFGTYRQVLVNKDDNKVVRLIDGLNNRIIEEERVKKLDDKTQRLVVYKPDPENPGKMVIELIKYTYKRYGTVEERIVYNRRLLQIADGMQKQYAKTVDLNRQLEEARKEKNETDAKILETRINNMKDRYQKWGLDEIHARLSNRDSDNGILKDGDNSIAAISKRIMIRPHDADVMAKQLEDYARTMGEFEAIDRQENLQKVALIEFVMFFVQSLGLQYNPFNQDKSDKEGVGITNMSIESVNKVLNNFEKGNYYGYGLIGDLCSACVPNYRKVDPEKDMPPSLKAIAAKLIQYLGNAHAARVRLDAMRLLCRPDESGETGDKCSREQEQAYLDEMSLWNKMAAVQIQKFEIVSHSIMLERIKSGDNSEEVRLRAKDAEAAEKLIKMAREQFTVKFGKLEERSQDNAKAQAAFKLKTSIEDLSYMNLSDRDMRDKLGAMNAKVKQLESLYLAEAFKEFSAKPENIEAFRASVERKDYYQEKAKGGLYRFFLDRVHEDVKSNLARFEAVAAMFEAMRGSNPETVQKNSAKLERAVDDLIRLVGVKPEDLDPETIQKNAKSLGVFQHWLGAASKQFNEDVKLFSQINMTDLSIQKIAPAGDPAEAQPKSWITWAINFQWMNKPLDWATRKFLSGGRDTTGDFASKVSSKIFGDEGWRIYAGPSKDGMSQIERRERIREFMQQGDFQTAADRAAEIDEKASGEARQHYRDADIQGLEDFGDDMDTMLTKGFSGENAAMVNASLTSLQKNFQPYIKARLIGQGVGDFILMSVGTCGIGLVEAGVTSVASNVLGAGAKLARGTEMLRWTATPLDFGSRVADGIKMSVVQSLAIPSTMAEFSEFGSDVMRGTGRMLLASTQFNLKSVGMFGITGAAINWGMYELNPQGSGATSGFDASVQGAIGGVAYGPKSGWVMLNMVPSNAVIGKGVVAKSYRGFANINGPIDGIGRLAMQIPAFSYRPFARALAAEADGALSPGGLWVFAANRAAGTKSGVLRLVKSGAIKFLANADGILKFVGYTEGGAEVVQWFVYHGKDAVSKKQDDALVAKCGDGATDPACYAPSNHLVRLVGARRAGIAAQQGAMLTIPGQGAFDPEAARKSNSMNAAMMEVFQKGGQKEIDFMKAATGGTDKINVDITNKTLPIRGLWKHEEELSVSSENQTRFLEWKLRDAIKREQIGYPELLAMQLIPATEVAKPGANRSVNYERWTTKADLREFVSGGKFDPKAHEGDQGAYFLKSELAKAAGDITAEKLLIDTKFAQRVIELKPKDTIIYSTKDGMVEVDNHSAAQIVKARLDRDPEMAAKIPADEKDIKTPIALGGVLKDRKLERSMVEGIVVERLNEDTNLAKDLASRALGHGPMEALEIDGVLINRPSIVRLVQDQVKQQFLKANEKRLTAEVMDAFRKVEAEKGGIDPDAMRAEFYKVWDRLIEKEASSWGKRGKILAWSMDRTADQRMTEYLARYVADYMVRRLGVVHGKQEITAEAEFAVQLLSEILKFGGMKDPRKGTPIDKLRGEDTGPMYRRGQKEMIREFYVDFLEGSDPQTAFKDSWDKAIKIFSFLEASGGKTLVMKLVFVPLLEVLAERDQKKLWVTSSNRLLAEQMEKEDMPAYSGGEAPNYKITPFDELIFEEVQRKKQGIRSLSEEHVLAGDEQDHPYELTSYTVGEDQGGLTMGNPLLPSNMKGLEWMQGKLAPALAIKDEVKRAEAFKKLIPEIGKEIPQEAHELAKLREDEFAGVHMMWPKYYLLKAASVPLWGSWRRAVDPGTPMRLEADQHMKIIRSLYGRMYDVTSQPGNSFYEKLKNYRAKHSLFDLFKNNSGVETYFRVMLEQQLKTLTLKDPSQAYRIDVDKGTAVPLHYGSEMPTLHTPERYTAQLLLMQELRKQGRLKPVKLENEFKEGIVMQMNEFDQRMKNTHRIATSGTASDQLEKFYERLGWVFSNKEGKTNLKEMTKLVGGANGEVTIIDRDRNISREDMAKGMSGVQIEIPKGIDYHDAETLKLFINVARQKQNDLLNGEKPLNMIAVRSLDEARVVEATLIKNGLTTNGEPDAQGRPTQDRITRYVPDFMQRMLEGGEYEKMVRLNNKDAMINGTADWVICVTDICGRGVDMPFAKYKGKIIQYTLHGQDAMITRKKQVQARMGEGRIFMEGVPYYDRGEFVEITHTQTLRADDGRNGYLDNVRKIMTLAIEANPKIQDKDTGESVEKMKTLLPTDPLELKKLQDGAREIDKADGTKELAFNDHFKDFAVRGEVYDAVYMAMLQAKQVEGHQQSGIVDMNGNLMPDTTLLTERDVKFIRNVFQFGGVAVGAGLWWFGVPPLYIGLPWNVSPFMMGSVPGTIAGVTTGILGNRVLADQQAQAAANQASQPNGQSQPAQSQQP